MSDVIKSYIGILAQGKHSYVTVENVSGDRFFKFTVFSFMCFIVVFWC